MGRISVIIVSWNARDYLRDCLASLRKTIGPLASEIIVVDNASTDGSPDMVSTHFPEAVLIRSGENLGFARANNLGMQRASGTLLALINSDVVVHPRCLQRLAAFLEEHPAVGLVGPKVLAGDGQVQLTCGRLPTVWNTLCRFVALDRVLSRWPMFSGFQMRHATYDRCMAVEVLSGCFWLARREAVDEVGGLDERFFFYAEDIDWCKRFRDAGWHIEFVPDATATHFGGGSTSNNPLRFSVEILRANLTYWQKHYGNLGRAAYYLLALGQHGTRLIARGLVVLTGLPKGDDSKQKLRESFFCLRWLLIGKKV